jgi:hypothetical protein
MTAGRAAGTFFAAAILFGLPDQALALQVHAAPEGLVAHQLAHIFYGTAIALLAYWLESNRLVEQRGWRLIQIACLLLVLWNAFAFIGHLVSIEISPDQFVGAKGTLSRRILPDGTWMPVLFIVLHLDHLVCVPALLCLLLGIRDILRWVEAETGDSAS